MNSGSPLQQALLDSTAALAQRVWRRERPDVLMKFIGRFGILGWEFTHTRLAVAKPGITLAGEGCDGFFCTVPQVTPNRRRACWIAVFLTHGRHEQHERAAENGGSPTPLAPFAPDMMHNLAGCRTFRHTRGGGATERSADWPAIGIAPIELRLIVSLRGRRRTSRPHGAMPIAG